MSSPRRRALPRSDSVRHPRMRAAVAALAIVAPLAAAFARGGETRPDAAPARPVVAPAELLLDSTKGTRVSLCRERLGHVATAVVFLSEECPVSKSYAPKVGKLAQEYADTNVAFLVVDCTPKIDAKKAGAFAAAHSITAPVLLDPRLAEP